MKSKTFLRDLKLSIGCFIILSSSVLYGCTTSKVIAFTKTSTNMSNYHPMLYNGILLGGVDQGKYIKPDKMTSFITGKEEYKLYQNGEYVGVGIGGKVKPKEDDIPFVESIDIKNDLWIDEIFAINCDWDCTPRKPVDEKDVKSNTKVVEDILLKAGLTSPKIDILYSKKIDLDGDSKTETLIYAENSGDKNNFYNYGDFSILVLKKTIDGKDNYITLKSEIGTQNFEQLEDEIPKDSKIRHFYNVKGFYDVDGDGDIEILLENAYVDGVSYEIYKITKDKPTIILSNGWGN